MSALTNQGLREDTHLSFLWSNMEFFHDFFSACKSVGLDPFDEPSLEAIYASMVRLGCLPEPSKGRYGGSGHEPSGSSSSSSKRRKLDGSMTDWMNRGGGNRPMPQVL